MAHFDPLKANLERRGFTVFCFDTAEKAAHPGEKPTSKAVGFGGSVTRTEMGLIDREPGC